MEIVSLCANELQNTDIENKTTNNRFMLISFFVLSGKVTPFFANGKIFYLNNCYPKLFCYLWAQDEEVLPHIADALLDALAFSPISA